MTPQERKLIDELFDRVESLDSGVAVRFVFQRLQPEKDRGQGLASLVVQLPCESRALELLRLDNAANGVTANALRERDCRRRPSRERLSEPDILVGEARGGFELVVRDHDTYRNSLGEKRDIQRGANTHPASNLLVHLGIVEDGVDALATSALEHTSGLRPSELEFDADEAVCIGTLAIGCGDAELLASSLGESDENEPGVDEIAQPSCDQAEERLELELAPARRRSR